MMKFRLLIYWHHEAGREIGGEYLFDAEDNAAAIKAAHALFDEQISLADQSEIFDQANLSVWKNEWPIVTPRVHMKFDH
jgi:hypothetical protein